MEGVSIMEITSNFGRGAKILLTGPPGIGKTTLLQHIINQQTCSTGGIICLEQREDGQRVGFKAFVSSGESELFMTKRAGGIIDQAGVNRIGKYFVDVTVINTFMSLELERCLNDKPELIYIDEIGRAEALSERFLSSVEALFMANCNVLATIVESDEIWSMPYKMAPQTWLLPVSVENRDEIGSVIQAIIDNHMLFEKLSETQKLVVREIFFNLISSAKYVSAKKLFSNSMGYVLESKIKRIEEDGHNCNAGVDNDLFRVEGKSRCHIVKRNRRTKEFTCDCDLFNAQGQFAGLLSCPQSCSHELCIIIAES